MIIFDLDGVLADCEHRRHFIDPSKRSPNGLFMNEDVGDGFYFKRDPQTLERTKDVFNPDWKAFFEACYEDLPIESTLGVFQSFQRYNLLVEEESLKNKIQIWSGRCESVRQKTLNWLMKIGITDIEILTELKMRPLFDKTPDDELKERWLNDHIAGNHKPIKMVFDDRSKVVRMWRRRGIFVFDCNQTVKEF